MEELYRTEQCWLTWRWISLVLVLYSFSLHKREIRSNPWGEKQKQKGRNIKEQARHRLKRWKIHEGYIISFTRNGPYLETVLQNGSSFSLNSKWTDFTLLKQCCQTDLTSKQCCQTDLIFPTLDMDVISKQCCQTDLIPCCQADLTSLKQCCQGFSDWGENSKV